MGEALYDPFDLSARALKGYRRGARLLGDLRGKRVLDVGCGLGAGSWLLLKRGARVTGVDVSQDAIEWARRTYQPEAARAGAQLDFWTVDLLAGVASGLGEFDALTVVDVLEHFSQPQGEVLLARLALLLRPGGRMFLHVPITANTLDWLLVARNGLLRKRLAGQVLDHHGDATHAVRYSAASLSRTLDTTGWNTEKLEIRAYKPRLRNLERAIIAGQWGPLEYIGHQFVTDWDGIQVSSR
jgi:2-polyprenyl-3-methyl-5-hydroxy-6-metoxy-1,4-benzoquinol methylase